MWEIFFLSLIFISASMLAFSLLFLGGDWVLKHPALLKKHVSEPELVVIDSPIVRDTRLSRSDDVHRFLSQFEWPQKIQLLMMQAGIRGYVDQYLLLTASGGLLGLAAITLAGLPLSLALIGGIMMSLIPFLVLRIKKTRRLSMIENQLPDLLDSIARSMQAGNSFVGALRFVSKEAPQPIAHEFRIVSEEINFGSSTRNGLMALANRIDSMDLRYFVLAVLIHSQTGGNLAELLLSLSSLIRERVRLKKTRLMLSAEGRLSAWILSILPIALGLAMYVVNPEFIRLLWTNETGLFLIKLAAFMMLVGIAWMWRIIHFRI